MAALVLLSMCGDATGPEENEFSKFSAKIDGVAWSPSFEVTAINAAAGLYSISAAKVGGPNNYTMVFSLYNITGPGVYPLGVAPNVFGGTANLSSPPSNGWTTPLIGTAGEINITTLTASKMVATFKFDTQPLTGSTGAPKVTEGSMDIAVSGTGGFALANQGNKVTGNIGGPFAAGSATGTLTSGSGGPTLTVVASNGTRNLTLSVVNMTGAGTYPLSNAIPFRQINVGGAPGNLLAGWGSQTTGASGSIQIISVTTSRVVGSFTATLVPVSGGATGNLGVSGDFDIARQF